MNAMFQNASSFNQPLNSWVTSSLTTTAGTFSGASSFNQPLSSWNVSSVSIAFSMFQNASAFDQDISSWDIRNMTNANNFLRNTSLSTANYDLLLNAWAALAGMVPSVQPNVPFRASPTQYTIATSGAARGVLTGAPHNWAIIDGGGI
jgi:surface protein